MDKVNKRTMTVDEIAVELGMSRSAAYSLAHRAVEHPETAPFKVVSLGGRFLVSRNSFQAFLEAYDMV